MSAAKFANDLFKVLHLTLYSYIPVHKSGFYIFRVHHYKNSLSPLHIFIHHCTFCPSLHVKTSPGACLSEEKAAQELPAASSSRDASVYNCTRCRCCPRPWNCQLEKMRTNLCRSLWRKTA